MGELLLFEKRDENRSYYKDTTRMHSSRVGTARLLTVSQHAVGVPAWGVYLPRGGCTCPGGVPAWERVYLPGDVPAWGFTCLGVYLPGVPIKGVYLAGRYTCRGYLPGGVPAQGCTCPG